MLFVSTVGMAVFELVMMVTTPSQQLGRSYIDRQTENSNRDMRGCAREFSGVRWIQQKKGPTVSGRALSVER
jgi:hypothetical protein